MIRNTIMVVLVFALAISATAAEQVTFESMSTTSEGDQLALEGELMKPQGNGPFPAVVLMHGALRFPACLEIWAERLVSWGYVALLVDSAGSRADVDALLIPLQALAQDAHDAKTFLAALPFVDRRRIGAMGWEQGGWGILHAIGNTALIDNQGGPFKVAVAFYPYCDRPLADLDAPLLILHGKHDNWCPANRCSKPSERETAHEVILKIYPGAYHRFDCEDANENYESHPFLYDAAVAADAIVRVRHFLAKHLQGQKLI